MVMEADILDLKKMKDTVDAVLEYSQGVPGPLATEDLIQRWYDSKKRFIDKMGGKLYIESASNITFEIPESSRKTYVGDFAERVDAVYHNPDLADFIFGMQKCFYNNITEFDYVWNDMKITKGSKIIKAFKHFEKDKEKLIAIQNEASLLIQNAKVSGKLCISVHPLDYLSSSENTYNWRSCHALDGEYRAGNLSYMTDNVTLVCYLKGEEEAQLPNFPSSVPWNSKKWRMLMFISEDEELIFAGRQYPFTESSALNICKQMLMFMDMSPSSYDHWFLKGRMTDFKGTFFYTHYLYINGHAYMQKDIIQDAHHSRHFNDLVESSYYEPVYTWKERYGRVDYKPITIGSYTYCIKCGRYETADSETMLCNDCYGVYGEPDEDKCRCDECGDWDWYEDMIYITDEDRYVCEACAPNVAAWCEWCNSYHSIDNVRYDEEKQVNICKSCEESSVPNDISDEDFF